MLSKLFILSKRINYICLIFYLFVLSCKNESIWSRNSKNLTTGFSINKYFSIGLGIHLSDLESDSSFLISKHFTSLSTANAFKFETIHPHLDEYDFKESDSIIAFAQKNNLKLRGHTLVWGSRNPYWLIWDAKGNMVNRKILEVRLKDHIMSVVGRYKNKIYAWDVVNEAVFDNNKEFLKPTVWYKIMGEEYIYKAFQYTHEVDSNAFLFYNDYDAEQPSKRDRIVKLINNLKNRNIPIHGIGIQGHWTTDNLNLDDLEDAIDVYSALGLTVQITELNIVDAQNPGAVDPSSLNKIANTYHKLFKVLLKHKQQISGVTFWQSELPHHKYFPLFDSLLKPTIVYQSILDAN